MELRIEDGKLILEAHTRKEAFQIAEAKIEAEQAGSILEVSCVESELHLDRDNTIVTLIAPLRQRPGPRPKKAAEKQDDDLPLAPSTKEATDGP